MTATITAPIRNYGIPDMFELREGEIRLGFDPAEQPSEGHLVSIGTVRSPWKDRADCPKNMRQARERSQTASVLVNEPYRPGLSGLEAGAPLVLLCWLGHAPRDLIVQKPRHAEVPRGTFSLRSPARPNPIGLHVVRLLSIDHGTGELVIDAIDVLDGTSVIDIKPWYASTDIAAEA